MQCPYVQNARGKASVNHKEMGNSSTQVITLPGVLEKVRLEQLLRLSYFFIIHTYIGYILKVLHH